MFVSGLSHYLLLHRPQLIKRIWFVLVIRSPSDHLHTHTYTHTCLIWNAHLICRHLNRVSERESDSPGMWMKWLTCALVPSVPCSGASLEGRAEYRADPSLSFLESVGLFGLAGKPTGSREHRKSTPVMQNKTLVSDWCNYSVAQCRALVEKSPPNNSTTWNALPQNPPTNIIFYLNY